MNIGFISIGSSGTMGHMTATTILSHSLSKKGHKCTIYSDKDYRRYCNIPLNNICYREVPQQGHVESVAGALSYDYYETLFKLLLEDNIQAVVFSTFFDPQLVAALRKLDVITILLNYPLRDSHAKAMEVREYDKYFNHILTLSGMKEQTPRFSNEHLCNPIINHVNDEGKKTRNTVRKILVSPGGGGRPSSQIFFSKIQDAIQRLHTIYPHIQFTVITGAAYDRWKDSPVKRIQWSDDFLELAKNHDLIISEAGYFTVMEMLSINKPCILLPGLRRIDNQELRALHYQEKGCGTCIFPQDDSELIVEQVRKLYDNPRLLAQQEMQSQDTIQRICTHKKVDDTLDFLLR